MQYWETQYQAILQQMEENPLLHPLDGGPMTPMTWYKLPMPGCQCAGGYPYCLYLKRGRTDNLIVFLIGGGLSWKEETARGSGTIARTLQGKTVFYTDEVTPGNDRWFFYLPENQGLFTLGPDNRFADWNIAMINYGTADFHIGQSDFAYTGEDGERHVLHHCGYANFRASLAEIKRRMPPPAKLLIAGESAGAFAVPALAADIADAWPECEDLTICSDSAMMLTPEWPRIVREVWRAPEHIARGVQSDNILVDLYRQLADRLDARARYLFACGVEDSALVTFQSYIDTGAFAPDPAHTAGFREHLARQVAQLQCLGVPFGFYIHDFRQADGQGQHCTLAETTFRTGRVEGVSPMDWLWAAVNGQVTRVGMGLLQK